jgi:putative transposase
MFGCQQVLIKPDKELKAVLEYICKESNKLHNYAVYYARQIYFKCHIYVRVGRGVLTAPLRITLW